MTYEQKIARVRDLVGDSNAEVGAYLESAKSAILSRAYPYDASHTEVPAQYDDLQCRLASRYYFRAGGEGEIKHSENGVNRTYGSVNDEDLLSEVIQYARLI